MNEKGALHPFENTQEKEGRHYSFVLNKKGNLPDTNLTSIVISPILHISLFLSTFSLRICNRFVKQIWEKSFDTPYPSLISVYIYTCLDNSSLNDSNPQAPRTVSCKRRIGKLQRIGFYKNNKINTEILLSLSRHLLCLHIRWH